MRSNFQKTITVLIHFDFDFFLDDFDTREMKNEK